MMHTSENMIPLKTNNLYIPLITQSPLIWTKLMVTYRIHVCPQCDYHHYLYMMCKILHQFFILLEKCALYNKNNIAQYFFFQTRKSYVDLFIFTVCRSQLSTISFMFHQFGSKAVWKPVWKKRFKKRAVFMFWICCPTKFL